MKLMNQKQFLPLNLQFFAEGGEGTGEGEGADEETGDDSVEGEEGKADQGKAGEEPKTFTQAELNKMMKAEKDSGKRSILNTLGVKTEKEAKEALAKYAEYLESQKTEDQKQKETLATLTGERDLAEKRAQALEFKLTALSSGVKPDAVDDVVALAALKVTEDKDLATVISEMKEKYPTFFIDGSSEGSSTGTGTGVSGRGKSGAGYEGIGARLAKANASSQPVKSSYFTKQ